MKKTKAKDYYAQRIKRKAALKKKTEPKKVVAKKAKKIKTPTIARVRLLSFVRSLDGRIFTVEFTKKDKTKRIMNARLSVTKFVKGTGGKPNGLHTSSIKVFDMQKQAYRHINLATVATIKADGQLYKVT